MTPATMMESALALVDRGFAVLPLEPRDKCPLTALAVNGAYSATRDRDLVRDWWTRYPEANIGVAPDHGLIALDVDPKYGGHLSLAELEIENGDLPNTLREWSGGVFHCDTLAADVRGQHIFFQMPDSSEVDPIGGELRGYPGVDARCHGKYVAVAPSIHPDSGQRYEWAVPLSTDIAIIPDWMLALIPGGRGYRDDAQAIPPIEGVYFDLPESTAANLLAWTWERHGPNRRETLAYLAYRLFHACTSPEQATFYMRRAAEVLDDLSPHQDRYNADRWIMTKLAQVYRRGKTPKPSAWRMAQILGAEQGVGNER